VLSLRGGQTCGGEEEALHGLGAHFRVASGGSVGNDLDGQAGGVDPCHRARPGQVL
jgi:hypothetical protein